MLAASPLRGLKRTEDAAPALRGNSTRFAIIPAGALARAAATIAGIGRCSPEVPAPGIEAARISRWRRSALPEMPMTIIGRHSMSASQRCTCIRPLRNENHRIGERISRILRRSKAERGQNGYPFSNKRVYCTLKLVLIFPDDPCAWLMRMGHAHL